MRVSTRWVISCGSDFLIAIGFNSARGRETAYKEESLTTCRSDLLIAIFDDPNYRGLETAPTKSPVRRRN